MEEIKELKTFETPEGTYNSFPDKTARTSLAKKLDAPGALKPGMILKVKTVGDDGTVVLEGVEPSAGGELPAAPTFNNLTLETAQAADGDTGVILHPEGTAEAPALTLYGQNGDEPVQINNVAEATDDRSVPNLGQVKALIDGNDSGQNVELDSSLTQSGKAADAKATGDEIKRVEGLIPSIEGLAKFEDIPTKPEDINAQPAGNYLTKAPVESVNGKTGKVVLSAADVGARPNTWTPTAQEVGALPNTYTPPNQTAEQVGADPKGTAASALAEHNTATDAHNDIRVKLEELRQTLAHFFNATTPETMDQISELVSGIETNADLIAALTTGKVSVSSIVANLTTNLADRPLAASMGVELKKLIDQVSASLANYQPKGDYALASAVPTKVSQLTNDKGYLTEHQDISGKLDTDKLPQAVKDALAQAKASGEFDGEDGDPGRGIKSIARTSGNGAAGTTDTYTITYTDDTTSTFIVQNGSNGAPGYTPKRKIDYWTDEDQESIVQQVIAALGTPVFGRVDEDCKIALTGELVDGKTYTFAFVDEDGGETVIGTYTKNNAPDYTNQIAISTDADGNVYNGTGYKVGYRLNSNGEEDQLPTTATNPAFITGFIPIKTGDVVLMKDCYIDTNNVDKTSTYGKPNWSLYTSYFTSDRAHKIKTEWNNMGTSKFVTDLVMDAGGYCTGFTFTGEIGSNSIAYIRLCLAGTPETAVVTINEAIE